MRIWLIILAVCCVGCTIPVGGGSDKPDGTLETTEDVEETDSSDVEDTSTTATDTAEADTGADTTATAMDTAEDIEEEVDADPCAGVTCESGVCVEGECVLRVFVSSRTFAANLGSAARADQECQTLADAAGLDGDYQAWLSDKADAPADRFRTHSHQLPYVLPHSHTRVANSWSGLLSGELLHTIDETEDAVKSPPRTSRCAFFGNTIETWVWTGTLNTGERSDATCTAWTNTMGTPDTDFALIGNYATTQRWSSSLSTCLSNCDARYAIYCFEQ